MLVNEYFQVVTSISNSFDVALQNVGLSITVAENFRNKGRATFTSFTGSFASMPLLDFSVFISSDLTKSRQRLSSQIQMDVGEIQMQSSSTISYYITSLAEGNIELVQKIWYQTENNQGPIASPSESNASSIDSSPVHTASSVAAVKKIQQRQTHNIQIEYNSDGVRKTREDVVIVPCVAEFKFTGKFYTLSKQALTRAYKNEDFLFRFDAEIKAPCDIDILDMFLICVSSCNSHIC